MNQVNKKRVFKYTKTSYSARYYSFLWLVILYIALVVVNKDLATVPKFIYDVFFKDWSILLIFSSPIFCWQIWSIIGTKNDTKLLEIEDDYLLFTFFGIFKEKTLELNYCDITSLEWSKDNLYHFVFQLKNGETKLIRTEIIDREKAFNLIQQKIKDNKNA